MTLRSAEIRTIVAAMARARRTLPPMVGRPEEALEIVFDQAWQEVRTEHVSPCPQPAEDVPV